MHLSFGRSMSPTITLSSLPLPLRLSLPPSLSINLPISMSISLSIYLSTPSGACEFANCEHVLNTCQTMGQVPQTLTNQNPNLSSVRSRHVQERDRQRSLLVLPTRFHLRQRQHALQLQRWV